MGALTTRSKEVALEFTGWSPTFFESVVKRFSLGPCKGCYSFERLAEVNRLLTDENAKGARETTGAVGGKGPKREGVAKELLRVDTRRGRKKGARISEADRLAG